MIVKLDRIIAVVLLNDDEFYHSIKFKDYTYLGEPINIVRLFNQKKCSELVILNIDDNINYDLLEEIASEAFMPLSYGGNIKNYQEAKKIFSLGYEKIVFKFSQDNLILASKIIKDFGSQAITICIDYNEKLKNNWFAKKNKINSLNLDDVIQKVNNISPGEIILQSIDRDGAMTGYDTKNIIRYKNIKIPIIPLGGCSGIDSFKQLKRETGICNFAASSIFVFKNGGILVNYPEFKEILELSKFK